eukprot:TRINITY_DN2336_c0_g2_i2.p1 TRINITY_DN2336_c0_g2~~TRINITY_DN2336_c0_g2_i2.p1  ORF type:complete len:115 (+),score=34.58 TRINITY_DN2336_c0_g2_i2:54-347(+)
MGRVFSWEYFSFLQIDDAAANKELLLIPVLLLLLGFVWMKLVRTETTAEKSGININEAYADVIANEVDSGTEIDSPDEDEKEEEVAEEKGEDEKKDD